MKNRHDQCGRSLAWQAKDVVMFTAGHPQRRVNFAHVLEGAVSVSEGGNPLFQLGDIAPHLGRAPFLARVADDAA